LYGWALPAGDARGAESGMDNSPRFDHAQAMTAIDLCGYVAAEYLALEQMATLLSQPADAEKWRLKRQRLSDVVNNWLWDDETRFYYDLDEQGTFICVKTPAGLIPMLGLIPDGDQAESLRVHVVDHREFWSNFPIASVGQDEPCYSNDRWRGPVWPMINLLIHHCLENYRFFDEAHRLAHRTLEEIARWYARTGCLFEYYDAQGSTAPADLPQKGLSQMKGPVADFHPTAAAYVCLAHRIR